MTSLMTLLFFGGYVQLSPSAFTLSAQCVELKPRSALEVKGDGAAIIVRLPYPTAENWPEGVMGRLDRIAKEYSGGRISGSLSREDGTTVKIAYVESAAAAADFELALAPSNGFRKGDKFNSAKLCADPSVGDALLFWRRVSK